MRPTRGRAPWRVSALLWLAGVLGVVEAATVLWSGSFRPYSSGEHARRCYAPAGWVWVAAGLLIAAPLVLSIVAGRKLAYLAGASLVLGIAVAGMWVRSHSMHDSVDVYRPDAGLPGVQYLLATCRSAPGVVSVALERVRLPDWPPADRTRLDWRAGEAYPGAQYSPRGVGSTRVFTPWNGYGFEWEVRPAWGANGSFGELLFTAAAPYWLLCGLCVPLPLLWLGRRRRAARQRREKRCPACGYDCRATPDRCPECGRGRSVGTGDEFPQSSP